MNRTFPPRTASARIPFAISAGLALALVVAAPAARASTSFTADLLGVTQVLCDTSAIKGQLSEQVSRYTGNGTCIELFSPQRQSDKKTANVSEFPDWNASTEIFRASWTSQGSRNS